MVSRAHIDARSLDSPLLDLLRERLAALPETKAKAKSADAPKDHAEPAKK